MDAKKARRLKAEALLSTGKTPKEVADELGASYQTILSWKRKMDETNHKDMDEVVQTDEVTIKLVADKIKETAPAEVCQKIDKLVDGVVGLQQLEPKFHTVVLNLLNKAETLSQDEDLSISDWSKLSNGIGQLYANIFNKSGVNVNVLNQQQVSGERLSMFKATMRGA